MNFNSLISPSIGGDEGPDSLPERLEGKAEECAISRLEFQRRNRPSLWVCGWRRGLPRGAESWRKPGLRNASFPLLIKRHNSLELSESESRVHVEDIQTSWPSGSDRKVSPSLCVWAGVVGDYCSHDFNSNAFDVPADLAAFIHCHGDFFFFFLPHFFSITKKKAHMTNVCCFCS